MYQYSGKLFIATKNQILTDGIPLNLKIYKLIKEGKQKDHITLLYHSISVKYPESKSMTSEFILSVFKSRSYNVVTMRSLLRRHQLSKAVNGFTTSTDIRSYLLEKNCTCLSDFYHIHIVPK